MRGSILEGYAKILGHIIQHHNRCGDHLIAVDICMALVETDFNFANKSLDNIEQLRSTAHVSYAEAKAFAL